jgi:DNA polymerase-1
MLTIDDLIDSVTEVTSSQHDVARINSIADSYKTQRQESKVPTFLLTYQGTYIGMMAQCDFSKEKAQKIEQRYHELYKESDEWIAKKLDEASRVGYLTVAFGLRVRTPLLHQVVRGTSKTPFEAEAEGRTAGNALGQSYCLLNTRASVEFMHKVRKSKYRTLIRPTAHIHDAQYHIVPDDVELIQWYNTHLVEAVEWQDDPAIMHDIVKLGGSVSVFYPSWEHEANIANGASEEDIQNAVAEHLSKLAKKGVTF